MYTKWKDRETDPVLCNSSVLILVHWLVRVSVSRLRHTRLFVLSLSRVYFWLVSNSSSFPLDFSFGLSMNSKAGLVSVWFFLYWKPCLSRVISFANRKIYYCRLVRLGLWETFHYKPCWNVFPSKILGTLAEKAFECSHNICGNNLHN